MWVWHVRLYLSLVTHLDNTNGFPGKVVTGISTESQAEHKDLVSVRRKQPKIYD